MIAKDTGKGYNMSASVIDGKSIAAKVHSQTAAAVENLKRQGILPCLAVILIGDNPASRIYVKSKVKCCAELGILSRKHELPADASQEEVLNLIRSLNEDSAVHGILVQFPPPPQISEKEVVAAIRPDKDVDCFHAENVGKLLLGEAGGFTPCTPQGVMTLLEESGIDPAGRHAVIIGRSNIVGKPLAAMLMQKAEGANATVTVVHSGTPRIEDFIRQADIVIAAVGKPEFVRGNMLKPGAAVIDVGINRVADASSPKGYRVVGDVCFREASEIASAITPVPGGVGPMTIAMLMRNTVKAAALQSAEAKC